ncbi:DUF1150 family protein [Pontivivens insulae]|uniref:DUF1150 domain-containing protein n=1 Tax=Pontivivens insulae TaxID=1639689 RepID=A0A2R8AE54_9RHOB|nr:DUF1150 family protein [Pontivivens insulae]RED14412.1 hypothetical protein DFR53_1771 [Pontivivens insulae]SPF30489.1 hypothetical protein POI8812_02827 [Pontivivens insulae]
MTEHPTYQKPGAAPESNIVYVRSVAAADLPQDVRDQTDAETLYAIHNAEGQRLALVGDRRLAFTVARQNEMAPVSVH